MSPRLGYTASGELLVGERLKAAEGVLKPAVFAAAVISHPQSQVWFLFSLKRARSSEIRSRCISRHFERLLKFLRTEMVFNRKRERTQRLPKDIDYL